MQILLETKNPCLNSFGNVDDRISCKLYQWRKEDPGPSRVKPAPFSLLHHIDSVDLNLGTEEHLALEDIFWMDVYFLCRPGE